jgi:Tfp pilus assembly protein PilO
MFKYIISLIFIGAAGAAFFLYTKPAYDSIQADAAQITEYDAALEKAAQLQALKQTLLTKYNSFPQPDLERLLKLLPNHVDNVALILDLDNLAARFGLGLENVDVSTPASAAVSKTAVGSVGANGQKYDSLTIKFSTHGTYPNFLNFLRDLEASLRVVDLVALSISQGSGSATTIGNEPIYTFNITLRTYWLK